MVEEGVEGGICTCTCTHSEGIAVSSGVNGRVGVVCLVPLSGVGTVQ